MNPPEGMPRITPYLFYKNIEEALKFLSVSFGFEKKMEIPGPDGNIIHAEMKFQDGLIMLGVENQAEATKSPINLTGVNQRLYVYVDDIEAHYINSKSSKAEVCSEIMEMFWGDKMYTAKDCEGHHWSFAQHVKDIAPEDMKPDF